MGMLLDSGAFSAWTKKIEIDIDEYIDFYHKHKNYIDYIINLDVIPGEWGRTATKEEAAIACEKGFENYYYMLEHNVPHEKLLHVFHQGDSFTYLDRLFEECTDYICISPANDKTTDQKRKWLETVYGDYVCATKKRMPRVRTHGLGVTALDLLWEYPFYSVDSTSWTLTSRFGCIFMPIKRMGGYRHDSIPLKINFSSRPSKPDKFNYNNGIGPALKEYVDSYIADKGFILGKSEFDSDGKEIIIEEGLINHYLHRDKANMEYFLDVQKSIPEYPWAFEKKNKIGFSL